MRKLYFSILTSRKMLYLLETAISLCLFKFYDLTGSYGFSLILLSSAVSIFLAPFYYLTGILENKERIVKQRLEPFIQKINSVENSKAKHILLKELYWSFSYYPFYSLRSLASLFIQIPMLFAAYEALTKNPLSGEKFLFIKDLGNPDFLFHGLNILPVIMTAINIASVFLSSQAGSKERRQGIFIAMVFFVLLYKQNSALLIYWTFNQLFNFIRYVFVFKTVNLSMPRISLSELRGLVFPKPQLFNFILAFAAMSFPAILIYKLNVVYFIRSDLQTYIALLFGIALGTALLFKYYIAVSIIIAIMFCPIIREAAQAMDCYLWLFRLLCVFLLIYFAHYFFAKQKLVLMAFFIFANIYCIFFIEAKSQLITGPQIEIPQDLAQLELKDSSSIYLFMHDAFPHKDYAEHLGISNYDEFTDVLRKNGFNVYDVYSLATSTLSTMYSVFQMQTDILPISENGAITISLEQPSPDSMRYFVSGNNIANMLLQNKGYKTGVSNISNRWVISKYNARHDFWVKDSIRSNLVLKAIFLRGYLKNVTGQSADQNLALAEFITENKNKNKIFAWTTAGPSHAGGVLSAETELKKWMPDYHNAIHEMQTEMETTIKNNPNAIIIFMSDHGPYLIDGHRISKNYDFNKADYMKFRDAFGAFMAIRFPDREKAAKYDKDFTVVQNLFPIIFAYLFDSEIPLKYRVAARRTELQLGVHKFDKGVFYKDFYKEEQGK